MKLIFSFLLAVLMLYSCVPASSGSCKDVSVEEAKSLIADNESLLVLDVRTPEEWSHGVIDGALKINFHDADFSDKISKLDASKPVLVYCKKGGRSAKATGVLEQSGFSEIYNLLGGYDAYSAN